MWPSPFSKGHKAEILLSALAACVLLVSYATIGAGL